jgi:hypothetical protein
MRSSRKSRAIHLAHVVSLYKWDLSSNIRAQRAYFTYLVLFLPYSVYSLRQSVPFTNQPILRPATFSSTFGPLQCQHLRRPPPQCREHPDHSSAQSQNECALDHGVEVQRLLNQHTYFQKPQQRNHMRNQNLHYGHQEVGQARRQVQHLARQ